MMRQILGWAAPLPALVAICALALTLASCGASTTSQWQALPIDAGAHVLSLVADPFIAGRVYAGADNGEVYMTNADQTGKPIASQGIPGGAHVNVIYPDPQHPGTVLAGTGSGLYRSQDDGMRWATYGVGLPAAAITALGGDGGDHTLLAGVSGHGVYISHDSGASWTAATVNTPGGVRVNALLCVAVRFCYAATDATNGAAGVYATSDGGAHWSVNATGLPGGAVYALVALFVHGLVSEGVAVYAGTTLGVYGNPNIGATWQAANIGLPAAPAQALDASAVAPGLLYVGVGANAYRSTDGGRHWSALAAGLSGTGANVSAIVGVRGPRTGVVVFAAAGQFARTPPISGGNNLIPSIIATLILLALLPLIISRINVAIRRRVQPRRPTGDSGDAGVAPGPTPIRVSRSAPARAPTPRGGRAKPTYPVESETAQRTSVGRAQTTPDTPITPIMPSTTAQSAPNAKAQQNGHSKPQAPSEP